MTSGMKEVLDGDMQPVLSEKYLMKRSRPEPSFELEDDEEVGQSRRWDCTAKASCHSIGKYSTRPGWCMTAEGYICAKCACWT